MMPRGRESTNVCGIFALYITSIIMMLITILLMVEDRCSISFAKKMLAMYIYHLLYVMKTGARKTRSFTLKPPIIIQSHLLTSLIALCTLSLLGLVMLRQRYTTPMVTVVCPVTNLHHMASLLSASSCNCTYAGTVSLMYNNTTLPLLPILSFLNIT